MTFVKSDQILHLEVSSSVQSVVITEAPIKNINLMKLIYYLILASLMVISNFSNGQNLIELNSSLYGSFRFDELRDTINPSSMFYEMQWLKSEDSDEESLNGLKVLPIAANFYYNSKYPRDFNNGAIWSGKGVSQSIQIGMSYTNKNFELTFYPTLWYAQNANFPLESQLYNNTASEFRSPYYSIIDLPQRFGNESLTEFNLGQSRIKYTWKDRLYAKVSTENMWWGPTYVNSAMMTNTASGFPHFALGIDRMLDSKIGAFDFDLYWGRLEESDYFIDDEVDSKLFTGLTFQYNPSFLEGFEIGMSRLAYTNWKDLETADFFKAFSSFSPPQDTTLGTNVNDDFDQLLSLYLRLRFPEVGFEAYYEYGRNDFGGDLENLIIANPDASRFYTFGFAKSIASKIGDWRVLMEVSTLSRPNTNVFGGTPPIYLHPIASGGYTHNGQLIGAPIGPDSNSQYFSVRLKREGISYEVLINRIGYNDGFYFDNSPTLDLVRDVEMNGGVMVMKHFNKSILNASFLLSDRDAWYFGRKATNFGLGLNYIKLF